MLSNAISEVIARAVRKLSLSFVHMCGDAETKDGWFRDGASAIPVAANELAASAAAFWRICISLQK